MGINVWPSGFRISDLKGAEREVYEALMSQLPDGSDIFCHVEQIAEQERREIDFVVALPGFGLAILEVKGGAIRIENGVWEQHRQGEWRVLSIAAQLDAERRMLNDILRQTLNRHLPAIVRMVVTPSTAFDVHRVLPHVRREYVIDSQQMSAIPQAIYSVLPLADGVEFDEELQDAVRRGLGQLGLTYADLVVETDSRLQLVEAFTREQANVLDLMQENERLYVRGGPGTGKTILAIEMASRLTREGLKVGLLCHNVGLANFLRFKLGDASELVRPVFIGNFFNDLKSFWDVSAPVEPESAQARLTYYRKTLPEAFQGLVASMGEDMKFDAWVVDEAQDFLTSQFEVLRDSLRNPATGHIVLFGDPKQDLYDLGSEVPWFTAKARLLKNVRSGRRIAEFINQVDPESETKPWGVIGGWPPEFHVVRSRSEVLKRADEFIDALVNDYQWRRKDVALLTTHDRHPKHAVLRSDDDAAYWHNCWAGRDVFYGRVNSFKGLERPVIVVALNGMTDLEKQLQQVFVGSSRARDDLVIFGIEEDLSLLGSSVSKLNVVRDSGY